MEAWLKPMLCEEASEVPEGDEWVIEPKLDGWRIIAHRNANDVHVYGGRNASDYTGKLPYIEGVLARLPVDTAVDGELMADEGGSGGVQSVMFANGEHDPSPASPPLKLILFDVLRVDGQDVRSLPWQERRALLEAAKFRGPLVYTSKPVPASADAHDQFLADGLEGSVAKHTGRKYRSGSRSDAYVKIKPQTTADAIVRGFKPGTGSRSGGVGAFEIEMLDEHGNPNGVRTRVGSGFTDALRAEIDADNAAWLDARIEIAHHGLGKTGKPRHPVFLRRRDDLTAPPAQPKPKRPRATGSRAAGGARPRNYGAMGDAKLAQCVAELRGGYGDATERAENKHTGLANELRLAEEAAKNKGLI